MWRDRRALELRVMVSCMRFIMRRSKSSGASPWTFPSNTASVAFLNVILRQSVFWKSSTVVRSDHFNEYVVCRPWKMSQYDVVSILVNLRLFVSDAQVLGPNPCQFQSMHLISD